MILGGQCRITSICLLGGQASKWTCHPIEHILKTSTPGLGYNSFNVDRLNCGDMRIWEIAEQNGRPTY